MTAMEFLLAPGMLPFTGAFTLVAGLLAVEFVMSMLGGSLLGDTDGPDMNADLDAGLDSVDIDGPDIDGPEADLDAPEAHAPDGAGGLLAALGFGKVPFIIWFAGVLTAFGLSGYIVQLIAGSITGGMLPGWAAAAIALFPGLRLGGWIASALSRALPKTESSAISRRSLGDRRGVIVQGTARRGRPAQARVRDGHGNLHYVRVEPVDDDAEIQEGTEVLIRAGRGPVLRAIAIDD